MKNRNYLFQLLVVGVIGVACLIIKNKCDFSLIPMPQTDIISYHAQILTISSVFCGFSLTNLTLLIEVHDEDLAKKLDGTDILEKRNKAISYSILYGAMSAFLSAFWVMRVDLSPIKQIFSEKIALLLEGFFFNVEISSLLLCIAWFLISSKEMVELVSRIYKPHRKISEDELKKLKEIVDGK